MTRASCLIKATKLTTCAREWTTLVAMVQVTYSMPTMVCIPFTLGNVLINKPSGLLTQYLVYMVYTPVRHGITTTYTTNYQNWDFCTVLFLSLIFADRHGAIFFRISTVVPELWALESNYYSTREVEKTTFTSFQYTNLPGFSERGTCPNLCQMLKEAMLLLLVTPCHVVDARLLPWSPPWRFATSAFLSIVSAIAMATAAVPW